MLSKIATLQDWALLSQAANTGDNVAQFEVAYYHDYGLLIEGVEVVPENKLKAFEWYYRAFKNGNADAITRVADFLSEGIYCDKNIELAIEFYKKAIENGSGIAANNLATIYRDWGDYRTAFELYQIAQTLDKSCSLTLAICHYLGIGTQKDVKSAHKILLEISEDSPGTNNSQYEIDEANYLLGKIYLDGEVVEKSINKARHFLKLADAENDHRSARELLIIIGRNI